MMTRREAHQRAAVYDCRIATSRRHGTGAVMYTACQNSWTWQQCLKYAKWRDDIEDAVLDCGRIKQG